MILITSLSVQDKLDRDGRRQAFVMELEGPNKQGEFVVEIGEETYGRLLKVYEAITGNPAFGTPRLMPSPEKPEQHRNTLVDEDLPGALPPPVPSATDEEVMSIQEKLMAEERRITSEEIGGPPAQFGGVDVGPAEAAMLHGIGVDLRQPSNLPIGDDALGFDEDYDDDEEDDGELLGEEDDGVDQM